MSIFLSVTVPIGANGNSALFRFNFTLIFLRIIFALFLSFIFTVASSPGAISEGRLSTDSTERVVSIALICIEKDSLPESVSESQFISIVSKPLEAVLFTPILKEKYFSSLSSTEIVNSSLPSTSVSYTHLTLPTN